MRRCLLLSALLLVACGGADRETFVREANSACRERAAGQEALGALPADELIPAATTLYEQELATLRELEPPEEDRARHAEWVRASADVVRAYRRYAAGDASAREKIVEEFDYAAALARELGLSDCDS